MVDFNIPSEGEVSKEPSKITSLEMADLSHAKRSTILYEQRIEEHKCQIDYLQSLLREEKNEKQTISQRCTALETQANKNPELRRDKTEMAAAFFLSTTTMGFGSLAIGNYPPVNGVIQWQASVGWALVILAIVMGIGHRILVWIMMACFPSLFHNRD